MVRVGAGSQLPAFSVQLHTIPTSFNQSPDPEIASPAGPPGIGAS